MKFFVVVWIWVGATGSWESPFSNTVEVNKYPDRVVCQSFAPLIVEGGDCKRVHLAAVMPADDNLRIPASLLDVTCKQGEGSATITLKCKE